MAKWLILLLAQLTPALAVEDCHQGFKRIASTLVAKANARFAQRMKRSYRHFADSEFARGDYEFFNNTNRESARHDLNRAIVLGVCEKRGRRFKLLKGAEDPLHGKHRAIVSPTIPESVYFSLVRLMKARSSGHFDGPFSFHEYLEHSPYARDTATKDLELGTGFGLIRVVDETGAYQFDPRFEIPDSLKVDYQEFLLRSMVTTGNTLTTADHNFANRIKATYSHFSDDYFTPGDYEIFNGVNMSTAELDLSRALVRGICIRDAHGHKLLKAAADPFAVNGRPIVSPIIDESIFHAFERLILMRSSGSLGGDFSFKSFVNHSPVSFRIAVRDLALGTDLGILRVSASQQPDRVFTYHFNPNFKVLPSFRAALEGFKARSIAITENALSGSSRQVFERIIKAYRHFEGRYFSLDDYKSYVGVSTTRAERDLNRAIARGAGRQDGRGFELLEEAADPSIVHPITSPYIPKSIFSAYETLQLALKSGDLDGVFDVRGFRNFAAIGRDTAPRNLELGVDLGLLRVNRGLNGSLVYQFNPDFEVPPVIKAGYREIPKETFVFTENVLTDGDFKFAQRIQRAYFHFENNYFSTSQYRRFVGMSESTARHDLNRAIVRKVCIKDRRGLRLLDGAFDLLAEGHRHILSPDINLAIRNAAGHLLQLRSSVNPSEVFSLIDFSRLIHSTTTAAKQYLELGVDMGMLRVSRGDGNELIYRFVPEFVLPGSLMPR